MVKQKHALLRPKGKTAKVKWCVKLSIIKEGDKVVVKSCKSKKKSDTSFSYNPTPTIEFDKKE